MKNLTIKIKLQLILLFTIITVSCILSFQSIYSMEKLSAAKIKSYKIEAYKNKELELKNYLSLALKSVDSFYQRTAKDKIKNEVQGYIKEQEDFLFSIITNEYNTYKYLIPQEELKLRIKKIIAASRYGKAGYFWINDFSYNMIMHPIKKEMNQKNYKNSKEVTFVPLAVKALENKKEAYIEYSFYSPSSKKTVYKASIVKVFEPYNWIIGTGAYIDNIKQSMQKEALSLISSMEYGKDSYFWIMNTKNEMLMHPKKPSLNGKSLVDFKDANGDYLFRKMLNIANNKNEGLLKYNWLREGSSTPEHKLSYVQSFKQWNWIIGTSAYVDEIEENITIMKNKTNADINDFIIYICISAFASLIVLMLLIGFISSRIIIEPLVEFEEGLLNFFKYLNRETNKVHSLEVRNNDEIGQMAKVVNENIIKTKAGIEEDRKLIDETILVLSEFEQGDLCQRVDLSVTNPALMQLKNVLNKMGSNIEHNIDEVLNVLEQYSNYNYLNKINTKDLKEHLKKLALGVNSLGTSITTMLVENKSNGLSLESSSKLLLEDVNTLNNNSNQTAASLEETAAALEEITSAITGNTHHIEEMSSYANLLMDSAKEGEDLANKTTNAMDEINDQVGSINEAITVIDQIAFQTNILSLNAAVEAATAGEAGKGFAVVAQEVRNLASRSAEAAKEIKDLVENAKVKANEGKTISQDMIHGYTSLNNNINKTISLIKDIEGASKEQLEGINQINDAVNNLDQKTQENVVIANNTQTIAEQTDNVAKLIVSSANEKEFDGKDLVKQRNHSPKVEEKSTRVNASIQVKQETNIRKIKEPVKTETSKKDFVANNDSDDWESF